MKTEGTCSLFPKKNDPQVHIKVRERRRQQNLCCPDA